MDLASVNGRVTPLADATVSVLDRGLRLGDGAYEVMRAYGGRPFHLREHLARLDASCRAIAIAPPALDTLDAAVRDLLTRSGHGDAAIDLVVTRGQGPRPTAPAGPLVPTVILIVTGHPVRELDPVCVATVPDIRSARSDIKSLSLLPKVLTSLEAQRRGAAEGIYVDAAGFVREGTSSNIFAVVRGTLHTPPLGHELLAGVTRAVVIDLCRAEGLPVSEAPLPLSDLLRADEAFLTSTLREVVPIARIDDVLLGTDRPITRRLQAAFARLRQG